MAGRRRRSSRGATTTVVVWGYYYLLLLLLLVVSTILTPTTTAFSVPTTTRVVLRRPSSTVAPLSPLVRPHTPTLLKPKPWILPNRRGMPLSFFTTSLCLSTPNPSDASPSSSSSSSSQVAPTPHPLIRETARMLRRLSWFSGWSQTILTVIAAVILLFAQSVTVGGRGGSGSSPSFVASGIGVLLSTASIVWTWGNGTRLSRRLVSKKPTTPIAAANLVRRAIRVGVTLNCLGLAWHLLSAQQIIGTLAIKVLVRGGGGMGGMGGMGMGFGGLADAGAFLVQPIDILIVQANANQLLSQFCSLVSLLYLTGQVDQLDPPSTDDTATSTTTISTTDDSSSSSSRGRGGGVRQ